MRKNKGGAILCALSFLILVGTSIANPPIYFAFLWHMHQPIYWPGQTETQTEAADEYDFDVNEVFTDRTGDYTTYPTDAIEEGIDLPYLGASVSFTGSLMENLDNMEANGSGFSGWTSRWITGRNYLTSGNNPRLDLINFAYYHPINPLIDYTDIRKQIEMHKAAVTAHFGNSVPMSKGFFPSENAFSPRIIPALADESIQWVIVDNIHFDRACQGYPWNSGGNLYEPNPSDQQNPNPGDWVQLDNVWAPTLISGDFGHRPHYVQYTNPSTGQVSKIIAVPGDRYMGVEDARGGYGALEYGTVMSQLAPYNTDASHPLLIVLAHDGDNYGGGTDSYYHSNFESMVSWLESNPDQFICTTIQDYLDQFPPDTTDIIYTEDGSWSGADNGDPQFLEWDGEPATGSYNGYANSTAPGYSADRNSQSILVAAKNRIDTANQISPTSSNSSSAYANFLVGQASDYEYWEPNPTTWDGHPTRAANLAVPYADAVIGGGSGDSTGPTIFPPQREPWNPGGDEWAIPQSTTFQVWSFVYDASGLASVNLNYRTSTSQTLTSDNETYSGGSSVSSWVTVAMSSSFIASEASVTPTYQAWQYYYYVPGLLNTDYDYYITATDNKGNVSKSNIRHVWVGSFANGGGGGGSGSQAFWIPSTPTTGGSISIYYNLLNGTLPSTTNPVYIHLGYDGWGTIIAPNPPMTYDSTTGAWRYDYSIPQSATTLNFVFANIPGTSGGNWDNNNSQNWNVPVFSNSTSTTVTSNPTTTFILDGNLDSTAQLIATSTDSTMHLYAAWNGLQLYLATEKAGWGFDKFIIMAQNTTNGTLTTAFWAKNGEVMLWDAFVGNENDNGGSWWFSNSNSSPASWSYASTYSTISSSAGAYLETLIDLQSFYGTAPTSVYLAAASYPTANSTNLADQAPPGNGNGNIDPSEFVEYTLNQMVAIDEWELYGNSIDEKK